jgi:hypothetical protein
VPVVPLLAVYGAAWVAEHIIEVAIVCGVSGALAVAAVVWIMRWTDRRDERRRVVWLAQRAREVPEIRTVRSDLPPPAERPALGFRDLHIHLDGVPAADHAAVIRQALNERN